MRTLLLGSAAISIAMIAAPAAAQYYPQSNQNYANPYAGQANVSGHHNLSARIGQLQVRLDHGVQAGFISRREARPIRAQIRQLVTLENQYRMNGFSGQERADLQQRLRTIRQQLRRADDGAQGRYAQWDREYGDDWNAQVSGRIDANGDGWDDRDYNRDGRLDDNGAYGHQQYGYSQQGYPQHGYPQPAQPTGIGGLISSVLGIGGIQVGQRAPSSLYAVPYQHQAHYRDGNGIYYRSDGRMIYQIDARTQTVVRIFPM